MYCTVWRCFTTYTGLVQWGSSVFWPPVTINTFFYRNLLSFFYRNVPKFSDRQVWANSADQDETARRAVWSGSTLFASPSASFGCIILRRSHLVQLLGWLGKFSGVRNFRNFTVTHLTLSSTFYLTFTLLYEPRHGKTNKTSGRPVKTQISLGIHPVWSESSLRAQWVAKDPRFLHAHSEDSDQTGQMPRLIWVFAGSTLILLVLSCHGSHSHYSSSFILHGSQSSRL